MSALTNPERAKTSVCEAIAEGSQASGNCGCSRYVFTTEHVMLQASRLLPAKLRRVILALAEVGNARHQELKLALLPRHRTTFVDVGANRGQFSRFMASFYDHVMVFEPIKAFSSELREILADNCTVHDCALADFTGPATFYVPASESLLTIQTASLIEPHPATARTEVTVPVRRLDDFALDAVSFIKVDIEGAEYEFLKGAMATIDRCRPMLLIEIEDRHTGGNTRRVFDLLSTLGYRPFIQRERRDAGPSSPVRHLMRGAAYAGRFRRIKLISIGHRLDEIYRSPQGLNRSFGDDYVNNFLFRPPRR